MFNEAISTLAQAELAQYGVYQTLITSDWLKALVQEPYGVQIVGALNLKLMGNIAYYKVVYYTNPDSYIKNIDDNFYIGLENVNQRYGYKGQDFDITKKSVSIFKEWGSSCLVVAYYKPDHEIIVCYNKLLNSLLNKELDLLNPDNIELLPDNDPFKIFEKKEVQHYLHDLTFEDRSAYREYVWELLTYSEDLSGTYTGRKVWNFIFESLLPLLVEGSELNYDKVHSKYEDFCLNGIQVTLADLNISNVNSYKKFTIDSKEFFAKLKDKFDTFKDKNIIPYHWLYILLMELALEYKLPSREGWQTYIESMYQLPNADLHLPSYPYEDSEIHNPKWFEVDYDTEDNE